MIMTKFTGLFLCTALLSAMAAGLEAEVRVKDLRCEHLLDPLGLDVTIPRFSWKMEDPRRGADQIAYQIQVGSVAGSADVWDSGKVQSTRCMNVPYAGPPLASRTRYHWRVRVWDQENVPTAFSTPAWWETGILNPLEWQAKWIGIQKNAALVRRSFHLSRPVKRARVYVTARGLYRLHINGMRVGTDAFTPDWTDYRKRSVYQTYDITPLLRQGENVVGAMLGKGWYGSRLGWTSLPGYLYGPAPMRLFLQMHVDHTSGPGTVIVSDSSWKGTQGPIQESTLYNGETYDAQLEEPGWDAPGFNAASWTAVTAVTLSVSLTAQRSPTIQVVESIRPRSVSNPASGVYVFDMGQNMVGWARVRVKGWRGAHVWMQFGEVLTSSGRVDTYNLRSAKAKDEYILKSDQLEIYEPHFTYHGFRYVEVTGYPGTPGLDDITGRVVRTLAPETGTFSCSSDLVNRIWENTRWSLRGNLFSVPTDCPQRDERLGWTGDAQAFWRTACYSMDLAAFSRKWALDLVEAQDSSGSFKDISPDVPGLLPRSCAPFWGDAGVVIPWTAWMHYGDTRIIQDSYPAMKAWMKYILALNPNHIWEKGHGNNYGDWLAPTGNPSGDKPVIATAIWAQDAKMMAEMASAIGQTVDAAEYEKLFQSIKAAFLTRFVKNDGTVGSGHQTPQVLALHMGLLPENRMQAAADRLVSDIRGRGNHLSTGFVGTGYLLPVLSEAGRDDVAYDLLLQTTHPSWGYMVKQGGTTIWERWNSDVVCSKRTDDLCSFNHFCFGTVVEWMYRYLAGIDLEDGAAGYDSLRIRPRIRSGITRAQADHDSIRGLIRSRWETRGNDLEMEATLPPGTTARVYVPAPGADHVRESGRLARSSPGVTFLDMEAGAAVFRVQSGTYVFTVGGLTTEGSPAIGQVMLIHLSQPARAGSLYQMGAAFTRNQGIQVPGVGTIPLDLDLLFMISLSGWFPTVFVNFSGKLDWQGNTLAALAIPPMPELVGLPFSLAAVTYDSGGINYISNGKDLKFTR